MTTWDLRLGDYHEVLADVQCDAVIVDAPYSAKTHMGHRNGVGLTGAGTPTERRDIDYVSWSDHDVASFVDHWAPRCRGWMVSVTDDQLAPVWATAMKRHDRVTFAPLPLVEPGGRVRLTGDGPSCWACWIMVARPRTPEFVRWGTLPGAYVVPAGHGENQKLVTGGKPLWAMQRLVDDYSRPGDLVCDPCAGGATTLLAALTQNRRAIGAELDPATHAKAMKRLRRGYTPVFEFAR